MITQFTDEDWEGLSTEQAIAKIDEACRRMTPEEIAEFVERMRPMLLQFAALSLLQLQLNRDIRGMLGEPEVILPTKDFSQFATRLVTQVRERLVIRDE